MPMFILHKLNVQSVFRSQSTDTGILVRACRLMVDDAVAAGLILASVGTAQAKNSLDLILLCGGNEHDCYRSIFADYIYDNKIADEFSNVSYFEDDFLGMAI